MVYFFIFPEIREEERKILERAGYFQSITVGVAPIVVVIASVVTFSVHMILGYDLTAAQVTNSKLQDCCSSFSAKLFLFALWLCLRGQAVALLRGECLTGVTAANMVSCFAQNALSTVCPDLPQDGF